MKYYYSFFLSFFILLTAYAQAPQAYYDAANGLTGFELKTALNQIIDDIDDANGFPFHQDQGYDALYDAYANPNSGDTDDYYENDGTVLDMYSEKPNTTDAYNYNHFQNQCGNYNGEGICYNREHLVPQSTFNSASPMKNDYFHVVPSDGSVNGARGSFPFGEVGNNPDYTSTNGSKRGNNTFPGYSGVVFEPIDEFKGDIARSVLYFAIRYEQEFNSSWDANEVLTANDELQFYVQWYIDLLISWHLQDPVSQREIDRNNNGYLFQGNRNPLIDNPAYVQQIWDPQPDTTAPTAPANLSASNITNNSVQLSWDASTDNEVLDRYEVLQDGQSIANLSESTLTYTVTGLTSETIYSFQIIAVDATGNISQPSNSIEVETLTGPELVLFENFDDCDNVDSFFTVSEVSDLDWNCIDNNGFNNTGAYQMNAFSGGQVPSLDWLITSNPIDFNAYASLQLSFYAEATFGNTPLRVVYSTDYDGGNSPSNFTWTSIPNFTAPTHPDGSNNEVEFFFDEIDISAISGTAYIAFKYDTTFGEEATRWTVDEFLLQATTLSNSIFEAIPIEMYPNPVRKGSSFFVETQLAINKIQIFTINGSLKKELHPKENLTQVFVEDFSRGIYLIKLLTDETSVVKKLIVH
ncbi:endonuclease [Psychroflexus salis]|uniref:endonuclease n=1 Tax=Psychroflexus salis TaxID=1526574 RepID=UPI00166A48AB|nr:endonuclease [Psychroflexus salis]